MLPTILIINEGTTLTIDNGITLTNEGTIIDYNWESGEGIQGTGTLTNTDTGTLITNFLTDSVVRHDVTLNEDFTLESGKTLSIKKTVFKCSYERGRFPKYK